MRTAITYMVIGNGSIGQRHISNLRTLFPDKKIGCASASGRQLTSANCRADVYFPTIESAVEAKPKFAIIASPASCHLRHALPFLQAGIPTLIEKPLCVSLAELQTCRDQLTPYQHILDVGYNLRYLPSAVHFQSMLERYTGIQHHVRIEVGQYLPDWRSKKDYHSQVSAQKALGGGALLELSHELDYLLWIFGEFTDIYAITGNTGTLDIDVEDCVDVILNRDNGPAVSLHLDLLQRTPARYCTVTGTKGKLHWDLLENTITHTDINGSTSCVYKDEYYDRNQMYLDELKRFDKVAANQLPPMIDLQHATKVMTLIEAIRYSSANRNMAHLKDFAC
jgi:predicted dehydrogenase